MQVVKLQHTQMLMTSGVDSARQSYGTANEETWGDDASSVKANGNTDAWDDIWSN